MFSPGVNISFTQDFKGEFQCNKITNRCAKGTASLLSPPSLAGDGSQPSQLLGAAAAQADTPGMSD